MHPNCQLPLVHLNHDALRTFQPNVDFSFLPHLDSHLKNVPLQRNGLSFPIGFNPWRNAFRVRRFEP